MHSSITLLTNDMFFLYCGCSLLAEDVHIELIEAMHTSTSGLNKWYYSREGWAPEYS
jgi:hypothetical protein